MVSAVASIDVRYVCMLIVTVGGWVHRLAALVGRLATSAKPYKRKIKEDEFEEKKERRRVSQTIVGCGCVQVQKIIDVDCQLPTAIRLAIQQATTK